MSGLACPVLDVREDGETMKKADIQVGATVLARVSGELREMIVVGTGQIRVGRWDDHKFQTGYRLRDKKTGREMPKLRRSASLRPAVSDQQRWLDSRDFG